MCREVELLLAGAVQPLTAAVRLCAESPSLAQNLELVCVGAPGQGGSGMSLSLGVAWPRRSGVEPSQRRRYQYRAVAHLMCCRLLALLAVLGYWWHGMHRQASEAVNGWRRRR